MLDRNTLGLTALAILVALLLPACSAGFAEEAERILEVLHVSEGMTVADVGAGDGEWAAVLSAAVGESGAVFATEVESDLVAELATLADNVTAVLGTDRDLGLEDGCCEAILLRMVYHHFTDPEPMRRGLFDALVPGGRIAVIDIVPQTHWRELEGVPDRGGHGIAADTLVAEMTAAGFELVERYDDWRVGDEDRYCVVFRRPG